MDEIEIRSAQLAGVRFADRLIDLVVVPYGVEAEVPHQGRMIRELVERGAFGSIDAVRRRISVNRDHDLRSIVGKAISFDPDAEDGLLATIKIASTPHGDEALQLASEGMLDASAGMLPKAQTWERGRSLRRITKAWLHHIALTPDPAYTDARVLAVRAAEPPPPAAGASSTPLLDAWRAEQLEQRFASLFGE